MKRFQIFAWCLMPLLFCSAVYSDCSLSKEYLTKFKWYQLSDNISQPEFLVFSNVPSLITTPDNASEIAVLRLLNKRTGILDLTNGNSIRIELIIRNHTGCVNEEWSFYNLGTINDVARKIRPLSYEACKKCHEKSMWNNSPLFVNLYKKDMRSITLIDLVTEGLVTSAKLTKVDM